MQAASIKNPPTHIPVLEKEVISFLDIKSNGIYIDGTCGLGGHSKAILKNLSSKGTLISMDIDREALAMCKISLKSNFENLYIKKNSYSNIPEILKEMGINKVSGIVLDLGFPLYNLILSKEVLVINMIAIWICALINQINLLQQN